MHQIGKTSTSRTNGKPMESSWLKELVSVVEQKNILYLIREEPEFVADLSMKR